MKFAEFLKIYGNKPFIEADTFSLYASRPQQIRSQVSRWIQKGWIVSLKRGLYAFNEVYQRRPVSMLYLANYLHKPSYISMEYALGMYDLIPEKITVVTSVTTKKTFTYDNTYGMFKYYSVREDLFTGYTIQMEKAQNVFIASPEKAIIDYFYFNQSRFKGNFDEFEAMRFQNLAQLDLKTFNAFKDLYGPKMRKIIQRFSEYTQNVEREYQKL